MKTANGVELRLSPATATILRNILREWIGERLPLNEHVDVAYAHLDQEFRDFKMQTIGERITRMRAVIEQLEE